MLPFPLRTLRIGMRGADVAQAQAMLNLIAKTLLPLLNADGAFGLKTQHRVQEFQQVARVMVDGVIGPQTWATLDQLANGIVKMAFPPPPRWEDDPFRADVVQFAIGEAYPMSKVGDDRDAPPEPEPDPPLVLLGKGPVERPTRLRYGWPRLKQYFDETVIGVCDRWWRQTGDISVHGEPKQIMFLDGVRGHDWRVPQSGLAGGMNWCGIFATWCWIQAGVMTRWHGGAPTGAKKHAFTPTSPPKPGDIIVINNAISHHCVLLPEDVGDAYYRVVSGNSLYQQNRVERITRNSIGAYYSLNDRRNDASIST